MKAETAHPSSGVKAKDLAMDLIRDAGMGLEASDYLELLGNVISECLVEIEDHGTRDAQKVLRRAIADFQAALKRMEKTGNGTILS